MLDKSIYYQNQEQYSNTLFLRKTSNKFLVAKVYGIQPGILISRFFWAARCPNSYSNLFAKVSYWLFRSLMTLFLSSMCLWSSRISCLKLFDLFSWIFFNYYNYLFLARSWFSVWAFTKAFSSSSLICHLARFSLASRLKSFSVFSRWPIFSLLFLISYSLSLIVYLSSVIKLSFSAFSSSRPLTLASNCLVLSSWVFLASSRSWINYWLLNFLS